MLRKAVPVVLVLLVLFASSCTVNLENVQRITYTLRVEEEGTTKEGRLEMESKQLDEENYEVQVNFTMDGEGFTTTFKTQKGNLQEAIAPIVLANPALAGIGAALSVAQMFLVPPLLEGEKFTEGFQWKQKSEEGETEVTVLSAETRFEREALWIEVKQNGTTMARVLLTKEGYFPLVVDLQDPEKEGNRFFVEVKEVTWK
ncbi:MAG: hypothetical protein H5U36_03415 [Candidatus Caldatribacterium sp.]|nr:hypothetical protein [Candidatus Caldatribacterium sp.]